MLVVHQHRRRAGVGLDVVHVVPEPLQADQVLQREPDDAGDAASCSSSRAGRLSVSVEIVHACHISRRLVNGSPRCEPPPGRAGLHVVQLPVQAAARQQLLVRALLDDPAAVEHEDLVGRCGASTAGGRS